MAFVGPDAGVIPVVAKRGQLQVFTQAMLHNGSRCVLLLSPFLECSFPIFVPRDNDDMDDGEATDLRKFYGVL